MDWLINTLIVALVETASDRFIPPKDRSYISAPTPAPKQSNQQSNQKDKQNESSNSTPDKK